MLGRRAQGLSQILLPWVPQSLQLVPGAVVCSGGGAGPGLGAGLPVPGEGRSLVAKEQAALQVVTAPPPRTPGRCPPLPPSPVSWVCPLVSSPELW